MTLAAHNAIDFLASRAKLTHQDACALCSIAASFRISQVVDIVRGGTMFTGELQQRIAVV